MCTQEVSTQFDGNVCYVRRAQRGKLAIAVCDCENHVISKGERIEDTRMSYT
jgi:hypothetical protein